MGRREVAFGLDRNVVRPQKWIAPLVHLIDRNRDNAITMREFERQIVNRLDRDELVAVDRQHDMGQGLIRVRRFRIRGREILGFVGEAQRLPRPIYSASRLRG